MFKMFRWFKLADDIISTDLRHHNRRDIEEQKNIHSPQMFVPHGYNLQVTLLSNRDHNRT